ncbi:hypothetical protein ACA910_014714 [Epithemia clementina (nom. ined.)]
MPQYGALKDLFQKTVLVVAEDKLESDEEIVEELVDAVEGGLLTAAIFGIIKGTVGPAIIYLPRGFSMAIFALFERLGRRPDLFQEPILTIYGIIQGMQRPQCHFAVDAPTAK